ncbi:hypothetical protein TIFTF001_014925 [Ficus carica]|uniref:Uncharacterized protein n=1 Tax=Ficus carica TaxID=3494 RepID=A0AA88D8H9_FICCA|nr:hypothetical protein TIFTF001_014925 [Ficus carica]
MWEKHLQKKFLHPRLSLSGVQSGDEIRFEGRKREWGSIHQHYSYPLPSLLIPKFLNKAAIMTPQDQINSDGSPSDPWRLCSVQQVEEAKCLLRVMPIWLAGVVYNVARVPQEAYVVFQALQSDRHLGSNNFEIPAASYSGLRHAEPDSFSTSTMLLSTLVEERRRTIALTKPTIGISPRRGAISSMSASWLIPQLLLTGVSVAFTLIGQVEFYYKQFPENMRSIAGSLYFCGLAGSSYLSTFLITTVHRTTKESASGN